ncbi:MAG: type II secretion system F family protein [Thiohalocapsa sp.]|nr:type II secretion system F family protein [Thiohalocapsa sp.]
MAELFQQLATLERAGLPPEQAFRTMSTDAPPRRKSALQAAARLAARGRGIGEIGARAGLFDPLDRAVVDAAASGGKVEQAYRQLAERHGGADRRRRRLKSKLLLPVLVFVLAAFVRPFPAYFAGEIDTLGYLLAALGPVASVLGALLVLIKAWSLIKTTDTGEAIESMLLRLPVLGKILLRRNRVVYLDALSMLIEAGVPALQALRTAAAVPPNRSARHAFERLHAAVERGEMLHRAFAECPLMDQRSWRLLQAGEVSGSLDATLVRISALERTELSELEDTVATWLPRIAYVLAAGWIAGGMTAGGFMTQLPAGLGEALQAGAPVV